MPQSSKLLKYWVGDCGFFQIKVFHSPVVFPSFVCHRFQSKLEMHSYFQPYGWSASSAFPPCVTHIFASHLPFLTPHCQVRSFWMTSLGMGRAVDHRLLGCFVCRPWQSSGGQDLNQHIGTFVSSLRAAAVRSNLATSSLQHCLCYHAFPVWGAIQQ